MSGVEEATRTCDRLVREAQAEHRVPALTAAVARKDRPTWTAAVGEAEPGRPVTADTAMRIGSITKTFTAVLVMQLRDEGLLDLDDPIQAHLPTPAHGSLTIRSMLSHLSGLQREPPGDVWDAGTIPAIEAMVAELGRAERVSPPQRRWHYSNLAYSLLGETVARLRGGPWPEVLHDRLLGPLQLDRTGIRPTGDIATGYLVEPYSDVIHAEPDLDLGGMAPAGQLWSTVGDLARWALFLADPDPAILSPATVEEMCQLRTLVDNDDWRVGWGLGLILVRRESAGGRGRFHYGHDGAMPGFLAGVYASRDPATGDALGAAALGSSGTALAVCDLPHALIDATLAADPAGVLPWRPGEPPPATLAGVLGVWWSEGSELVFSWHTGRDGGRLEARSRTAPADRPPAVFAVESDDVLRGVSGPEAGERLVLTRDGAGGVVEMHWATYRCTRTQQTFVAGRG